MAKTNTIQLTLDQVQDATEVITQLSNVPLQGIHSAKIYLLQGDLKQYADTVAQLREAILKKYNLAGKNESELQTPSGQEAQKEFGKAMGQVVDVHVSIEPLNEGIFKDIALNSRQVGALKPFLAAHPTPKATHKIQLKSGVRELIYLYAAINNLLPQPLPFATQKRITLTHQHLQKHLGVYGVNMGTAIHPNNYPNKPLEVLMPHVFEQSEFHNAQITIGQWRQLEPLMNVVTKKKTNAGKNKSGSRARKPNTKK